MKINKLLKIVHAIDGLVIPSDMWYNYEYYSESEEDWISILDMELVHLIRIARKDMKLREKYEEDEWKRL